MLKKMAVAGFSVLLLVSIQAQAKLITYEFSGELNQIADTSGLLDVIYNVGDRFTGTFSFDTNLEDGVADPNYFSANDSSITSSVRLPGYEFVGNRSGSIDLQGDSNTFFLLNGFESDPFIDLGSNPGRGIFVRFLGRDKSFKDKLPSNLKLSDFESATLEVFGDTGPGGPTFSLSGNITTLQKVKVPEPSTLGLLGIGLLGLGFMRLKRAA